MLGLLQPLFSGNSVIYCQFMVGLPVTVTDGYSALDILSRYGRIAVTTVTDGNSVITVILWQDSCIPLPATDGNSKI
jgi:hypothetical protein